MTGQIHSVQSLGAVDGPGLRYVVFFQGCPLRCAYCHNPDTWKSGTGQQKSAAELLHDILRCRPYFGGKGGVTLSGGEPLFQPEFAAELLSLLKKEGIHTALDTSGVCNLSKAEKVLAYTDLVLLDLKFTTDEDYEKYAGGSLKQALRLGRLAAEMNIPIWVRHVVVPGINDTPEDMKKIKILAEALPTLEKIEWLPFHKLCLEKYQTMGIDFPFKDFPPMDPQRLEELAGSL